MPTPNAVTPTQAPPAAVDALRAALGEAVVTSASDGFDAARSIWNGMIDRHPAALVVPRSTQDVSAAVKIAAGFNAPVAVRGGGHNVAGTAMPEGAIVIDLSSMRDVTVDPDRRVARTQGGATIGDVDGATQKHGLAVPLGVVSETGIAGLTLGGGLGWLRRRYGLSADNVVSAEVVLADGSVVTASEREHQDLFWAIRGGGGNFGVVTSFELRGYPIGNEVTFCAVFHPLEEGVRGAKFFREYMQTVPDDLSAFCIFGEVPHADVFPEASRGRDAFIFLAMWIGDPAEGERIIEPLRSFTTPLGDLSGRWSYLDAQTFFDEDYPRGGRYYWKSQYLKSLSDGAIEALIDATWKRPSNVSTIDLWHLGGAIARVPAGATPVPQRDAQYLIGIEANWTDPADDEANMRWARDLWAKTQSFEPSSIYVNFAGFGEEGDDLVRAAYGSNYARLAQVKKAYDPGNVFRFNQNIKPAP